MYERTWQLCEVLEDGSQLLCLTCYGASVAVGRLLEYRECRDGVFVLRWAGLCVPE